MNLTHDARPRLLIGIALAALMAATRGQQFAPLGQHLPDASLAVFFLAGFYLPRFWGFMVLFAFATLIDLTAIGWGGVSGYCLTPAYWLLVPAYGSLWAAGRWYAGRHRESASTLPVLGVALLAGGLAAELFASGGFYLFSGRFADLSLVGFAHSLMDYLPGTLLALLLYVGLAALVHRSLLPRGSLGRVSR
ncbi:MAG: hypothetical protein ACM3ST_08765 [Bdellovibrio bacteriovorus]